MPKKKKSSKKSASKQASKKRSRVKLKKQRKLAKPKKPGAKKSKAPISESAIEALMEKGKHRGFVTQAEIINSVPNIEKDIVGLERLYDRLESANINIIESGRVFEEEKDKEYEEKKRIETEFGETASDSVQMYLKEIGQYPLLVGDEEI